MVSPTAGLDELLMIARDTALAAGALALQRRHEGVEVADTKSTPIDIVTRADRETEQLIRSLLADARPNDGFLGEESGAELGTSGLTWIVDPIDGTVNYLYGFPAWAVSIAVVEGDPEPETWTAQAGAVVNPPTSEIFTAARGGGAWQGDRRIHANSGVELDRALVGTGFGYSIPEREPQIALVGEVLRRARDVRRMGAAALDLCSVANGRLDAYYERGLKHWDMAAGALIAQEAGALVTGLNGTAGGNDYLVAANPGLAHELLDLIRTTGAPDS
ncbi:inositol monophosphatase family protein [Amnibacterium flavum]|uniref:Inositol-1-monophosphatase n=1 Tax=Amnibacterium flavum TaxID=2173173 RepID=A0A2V1HSM1_9MICO|nr:inositol monophosphatase family protein [Amnibacterium flavum]PVZ95616.1 inositol monophosphatase [Amnibacterium flavum]